MTHYWWMHWFWITVWICLAICKPTSTLHSNTTEFPALNISNVSISTSTSVVASTIPPTTLFASMSTKNHTGSKNTSHAKSTKPFLKKIDFLFQNLTRKNKTTVENVTEGVSETQLHINSSFTLNRTDNLTYLGEDVGFNQSAIQNSERIGIEEEDDPGMMEGNLTVAGIAGITLGCIVFVGILSGISYFIYRNRGFNRPQVLNDHCSNPDSSGYIDDASVRDNSEEMYSLDNDSFLNSLEAMTIQNYWTDTVKHTKL